ncbi:hypothetical protein [Mesorhizobium sp. ANAO-SY3R2]|uniref:hypothetical protein n=1 Tax=Mesorhizobium sp. ANAO-SY3R2 TaxID=3166644 RepID=UPI003670F0E0
MCSTPRPEPATWRTTTGEGSATDPLHSAPVHTVADRPFPVAGFQSDIVSFFIEEPPLMDLSDVSAVPRQASKGRGRASSPDLAAWARQSAPRGVITARMAKISPQDLAADLCVVADKAVATIAASTPLPDEVFGHYVGIAATARSICFHDGRLLKHGIARVAQENPDLRVLSHSIRLPIVPAALDALSANSWERLEGLSFDATTRTRQSYAPDLVVVNQRHRCALILELKRSPSSYGESTRLDELKTKMMATALVSPDWLYKEHKRLPVDTVGVAIIDGMSRTSNHDDGVWSLSEIDSLLEIDGAAAAMAELTALFATKVQKLLEAEARAALETAPPRQGRGRPKRTVDISSIADIEDLDALEAMIDRANSLGTDTGTRGHPSAAVHIPRRINVGYA